MMTYNPPAGIHIHSACAEATEMAIRHKLNVSFSFNGIQMQAAPDKSSDKLESEFQCAINAKFNHPDAVAARAKQQKEYESENAVRQAQLNAEMLRLPACIKTMDETVLWLKRNAPLMDWVGIKYDSDGLAAQLKSAGFKANRHVGKPPTWFNTRERMGQYIVGQVLECLANGMPPHLITVTFCEKYLEIKP